MRTHQRPLLAGIVVIATSFAPQPTPSAVTLPLDLHAQQAGNWCWAASANMVMRYLKPGIDTLVVRQCKQADAKFGRSDCCQNALSSSCDQPAWPDFPAYGFKQPRKTHNAALSLAALKAELKGKRPVAFSWRWRGGNQGHMMVAYGYETSHDSVYILVANPWAPNVGGQYRISYAEYVEGQDHTHWDDYYALASK